jgi:hypothetical protein
MKIEPYKFFLVRIYGEYGRCEVNCAKCGLEITSCTTVNGLIVCDWCKPPAQASACPRCGHPIELCHFPCGQWEPAPPKYISFAERAAEESNRTTAYKHVPLTTGASLEPERPNFSGWTEEKPSESAERENQAQRYAHEMDCSTEPLLDFKAGWDAAILWVRKNGGGDE